MRMVSLVCSAFAFAAMTSVAQAESTILRAAEPLRLTETQMDAVTSGALAVAMGAFATADGSNTRTYTSTSTIVFSTPKNNVDIGLGFGRAYACCGSSTYTNVQTAYYAEGDIVIGNSMINDTRTPLFSFSHGVTMVIAVDVPSR